MNLSWCPLWDVFGVHTALQADKPVSDAEEVLWQVEGALKHV
jgi:hypothetical protein